MSECDFTMPFRLSSDFPHVADYFGVWSVYAPAFEAVVGRCQGMDIALHIEQARKAGDDDEDDEDDLGYELTPEGIALFMVSGPMMKARSSMSGGTSTVELRRQIGKAKRDPACRGGMFLFDTPGGTAKGNADLANDVAAFAAAKPCMAFVEDMCASAGVSIASQCPTRYANTPGCLYGAMGTYAVLTDSSEAAAKLGVKVHVVKAGEYKGIGEPGTPITEQALQEAQRIVDLLNEQYLGMIASGLKRSVESIRPLADGRMHAATDAVGMGLLSGIKSFDAAYAELVAQCNDLRKQGTASPSKPAPTSSVRNIKMEAATLAELKAKFPKSTAEWRETQIEAGATLSDAAIAYAAHVQEQSERQLADLQAKLEAASKPQHNASLGHRPLRDRETFDDASESGDAREDFESLVHKYAGDKPSLERRQAAIRQAAKKNPRLYQAYLMATNSGGGQTKKRLMAEKLDYLNTDPHATQYAVQS